MNVEEQTLVSKVLSDTPVIDWILALGALLTLVGLVTSLPSIIGILALVVGMTLYRLTKHVRENEVKRWGWYKTTHTDANLVHGYRLCFIAGYEVYRIHDFTTEREKAPSTMDADFYDAFIEAEEDVQKRIIERA